MDYSTLTDSELNRAIGIYLGWSVIVHIESGAERRMLLAPHDRAYSHEDYQFLIGAGGEYARRRTNDEAWGDAPQWTTDLNAAWELMLSVKDASAVTLQKDRNRGKPQAEISVWQNFRSPMAQFIHSDDNPARACCVAWLKYMDAIKVSSPE